MKVSIGVRVVAIGALLSLAAGARGETVSYTANLNTSKGNPVTHILILETNGMQPVQPTIYPIEVPGKGTAVISHDVPFVPTRSLLIGLTEGADADGNDKTQIIMFLDGGFAAANAGVQFSTVFQGVRHSETIARLQQAVAGDAAQLAWFTDTFFTGPAAGAQFETGGSFVVAEFTSLTIIGTNATAGNWMITSFQVLAFNNPSAQSGRATAVIGETAKIDTGPFDIELSVADDGHLAFDKTVLNNTPVHWRGFQLQLGTGVGANFVASTPGDGLGFVASLTNREETGAFPNVVVEEDRMFFGGSPGLPVGGTAHFVVFVSTTLNSPHTITLRQIAITSQEAPVLAPWSLLLLAVLLCGLAAVSIHRAKKSAGRSL